MMATSAGDGPDSRMRTVQRGLLVMLAAVALAVAVTSLIRTTRSFFRLDFQVSWVSAGLVVEQVPSSSSAHAVGLVKGDLIVVVDGTPVQRLEDPFFVLAAGDEHLLVVRDQDGVERAVTLRPPPPKVDAVYLARTAVATFALVCALWAVVTTRRREAATFLLLAIASLILGAMPHRTAETVLSLRVLHRMAGAAVPFLTIRFFALFPQRRHSMRLWDLLAGVMVVAAMVMTLFPNMEAWWPATASLLRGLFATGLLLAAALCVVRWRTAIRVAPIRRQIEWAALGLFVGLLPFTALVLLPRYLGISSFETFSWLAILPIAAIPLGFLAGLTEYRLWDLEPIARDSISATVVMTAGGLIFVATNHLLLRHTTAGTGSLRNLVAFATGVLLVVLLQPVRHGVQRFLDQWLYHGRPTPRWLLTHATRDLARATDPRELLARLTETLHDGLEFELVAAYLRTSDGQFELVSGEPSLPPRLSPKVLDELYPHPQEQPIRAAGFALRVPLERVSTVHGLLYLGLRRGIFPLGTEGREVVSSFAAQAALGLESARLLDDLRRQAEEYRILHANTQRIIESSAAGILVCDAGGRVLSANLRAAAILGEDSQAMTGTGLAELVELPTTWQPQLPLHAVNAEARTRGEQRHRVVMAVSVLELDSGSFNGRVVVLQDVTELRELQDQLREQEWLATLGRLASGLAHEINTPLTGIASFAQMLGDLTPADDPRAELVAKLVNQSFRVSRIVANLHEAVRGSKAERTMLDLGEVAERAATDAQRSLIGSLQVEIEVADTPVMVWGSPGPVELAVSNLVRNAIEASPADEAVRVDIAGNETWGEVVVSDHGPGVPEELRDKVFEPFFTTKTERGGTGLGLAITRDMIVRLGGEIELTSPPDGGTRAVIRLPRWQQTQPSS